MSEYIKFNTTLSPGQKTKMRRAKQDGCSVTITIKHTKGPHELMLTERQFNKIKKNGNMEKAPE